MNPREPKHQSSTVTFPSPIVTAARLTPSALATSALVIPSSIVVAHGGHRSGPL